MLFNRLGEYQSAVAEAEEAIKRNPAHAFPQSNLAYALRGAGRFDRARDVAAQAVARNLGTGPLRRLLYQLSEMQGDQQTARAQLEWAATSSLGFDLTGARAQIAAFRGRMSEARQLYEETIAAADARGFAQIGSGYAAQAALTEAVYGFQERAAATARKIVQSATANEPQLRAATALALAGGADDAESVIRKLRNVRPDDTLLHTAYLPAAEAAVQIQRGKTAAAIEALRPAIRYERGIVAALIPAYLRGEARLRARQSGRGGARVQGGARQPRRRPVLADRAARAARPGARAGAQRRRGRWPCRLRCGVADVVRSRCGPAAADSRQAGGGSAGAVGP